MAEINCVVCGTRCNDGPWFFDSMIKSYPCPMCGDYRTTYHAESALGAAVGRSLELAPVLSYAIRRLPRPAQGLPPTLSEAGVQRLLDTTRLPEPAEQLDNLILWLGRETTPGEHATIQPVPHQAIIGATKAAGVGFVLDYMEQRGFITFVTPRLPRSAGGDALLTFDGWTRYAALKQTAVESRLAFMAMPFGDAVLDGIYRDHFRRAVQQAGFELRRLDEDAPAGSIDNRLRVELRRARFAVVELTGDNSGAYWEAGFAEGLGRPVFYTCREGEYVHFDARQQRIVFWTPQTVADAAARLKATIRVTVSDASLEDQAVGEEIA